MSIITQRRVIIDGEDYQLLSSALELARRYIEKKRRPLNRPSPDFEGVDEFDAKELIAIQEAMDRYWE